MRKIKQSNTNVKLISCSKDNFKLLKKWIIKFMKKIGNFYKIFSKKKENYETWQKDYSNNPFSIKPIKHKIMFNLFKKTEKIMETMIIYL